MLRGINILGFYNSFQHSRWNNTDIRDYIVTFQKGIVPVFFLPLRTGNIEEVQCDIINVTTNEVVDTFDLVRVNYPDSNVLVKCHGHYFETALEGSYYLGIKFVGYSSYTRCSEVFQWLSQPISNKNLAYFKYKSYDLVLNNNMILDYSVVQNYFTDFYLYYNGVSVSCEIVEDGVEKPYGNVPVFNTITTKNIVEINGTKDILKFLFLLRLIETNGEVTITLNSGFETYTCKNISVSIKDDNSFTDNTIINFEFSDEDYISVRNEI